jgi:hypothetical protein
MLIFVSINIDIFTMREMLIFILSKARCEDRLNVCERNLDPIYYQPEELRRKLMNCRVELLEEKLRAAQCDLKV